MCHRWFLHGPWRARRHARPGYAISVTPGRQVRPKPGRTALFAAVRPATGQNFALVLPRVSTPMMQLFLDRFAATLAPDEHAAMVLDGAGWHIAHDLRVPENVTLVLQLPYSPEV